MMPVSAASRLRRDGRRSPASPASFTLVEVLVAISILMVVLVFTLEVIGQMGRISAVSNARIDGFRNAQAVLSVVARTLSRAELNTYLDYADGTAAYLPANGDTNYPNATMPANFMRASELHFLSGAAPSLLPGGSADNTPGDVVFFQAPLGISGDSQYKYLTDALNSVGFHVQYGSSSLNSLMPAWLRSIFGGRTYRYMLLQAVEPTESLGVYASTASSSSYGDGWLQPFRPGGTVAPGIVAENVLLFIVRPRVAAGDEAGIAAQLGAAYDPDHPGSVLAPNYAYDSRAWMTGYSAGAEGRVPSQNFAQRRELTRNQLPPIVDIVLVCADPVSLARFETSETAPAELRVPSTLFVDSSRLQGDLAAYGAQLDQLRIRYGVFQTSVRIKAAKWSGMIHGTGGF